MKSVESLLDPFCGYLRLGMLDDAEEALETLPNTIKVHPLVQEAWLILLVEQERWEDGVKLGTSLCKSSPLHTEYYFKTAYCLHELKRTEEAKRTLLEAPESIQELPLYFYNLACYETQLGNLDVALALLVACSKKTTNFDQLPVKTTILRFCGSN